MSNIIILAGSERKDGNTDMLVDAFKKGAVEKNKVEVISVRSHDITPCIGCNSCFTRPGNECFQKDDMQIVYEKLFLWYQCAAESNHRSPSYSYEK